MASLKHYVCLVARELMGKSNPLNFMYEAPPGLAKGQSARATSLFLYLFLLHIIKKIFKRKKEKISKLTDELHVV